MKLLGYLNLTGVMTCETGLLVGGNDSFGIGEINKAMIRQTFNGNRPYLPGSSLKGKMRNLLEQSQGVLRGKDVHSCDVEQCPVCRVFGAGKTEDAKGLTRLVVRDAPLITEVLHAPAHAQQNLGDYVERVEEYRKQNGSYVEIKTENVINRRTGAADKPRRFERVPAGMKFAIDLSYRIFEQADDAGNNLDLNYFRHVAEALDLVRWDYLGASGSRGYGRVDFSDLQLSFVGASSILSPNLFTLKSQSIEAKGLREWEPDETWLNALKTPAANGEGEANNAGSAEAATESEATVSAATTEEASHES